MNTEKINDYFKAYNKLHEELEHIKDSINGELNRIAISDDEKEVENLTAALFINIRHYIATARSAHIAFEYYEKALIEFNKKRGLNNNEN